MILFQENCALILRTKHPYYLLWKLYKIPKYNSHIFINLEFQTSADGVMFCKKIKKYLLYYK